MTFQLPDATTPFGQRVARRLREELIMWMTVVDTRGMPQPAPVWFWWDEAASNFLIYSQTHAKRLDFLQKNAQTALNFDGNGQGGDIIVFTGRTEVSSAEPPADQHQAYLAKYREMMIRSFGSPAQFVSQYGVALRMYPGKVRGH